ncbi:MAG: efflux RND transporter periplasmic adaptor subunit [Thermodesulfovibrio sp.]|nr:efflux RND transporter periplasmic adaptor subunit [Thermodesulfovibrio sp.]
MNKKVLIVAVVTIVSGFLFYLVKPSLGQKDTGGSGSKAQQSQPAAGHQGHGGGGNATATKSAVAEQPQTEVPTVEISTDSQKLLGVRTIEAVVKPATKIIRTVGRIEYDERRISTVNTKFEGWIEKLYVNFTGRPVKKGEPLADIYSPELFATQQELINAIKWKKEGISRNGQTPSEHGAGSGAGLRSDISGLLVKDAESIIEATRQRLRLWDLTEAQIKTIEDSGKPVRTFVIFSPANGYILQKTALQGMKVMPGEKLFDIADLSSVWVIADVYEYDLPFVKEGQSASLSLSYFPGKEFSAKVDYIYPALSADTKTAKIRLTLPNKSGLLKPQMFANVSLKMSLGKRLIVPEEAVIDTGVRQVIYVDKGEGNFEPREVMTGIKADGMVEITRGLKAGEKVASSANFLVDSEAQLKGIKPLKLKDVKGEK